MNTFYLHYEKDGQRRLATERRSPYSPDSENGQLEIRHLYKKAEVVGLAGCVGVSMLTKDGERIWFDKAGRAVDEGVLFGA